MSPTQAQWITLAFVIAVTAVVIAFDVWAYHSWGVDATISRVTRWLFGRYPVVFTAVVFALGVLVGHIGLPAD